LNKVKKIVKNLITPGETLSQKVVKGGFWFNGYRPSSYVHLGNIFSNRISSSFNSEEREY